MKKLINIFLFTLIVSMLFSVSAYCSNASSVSVEYLNDSKSLALSGTAAGLEDDAITVFIYDYNAQLQGVADKNSPKVFDTFLLGENGTVNYELFLPDSLVGGKYVVRIATRGGFTEKTFMHINDELALDALSDINASSQTDFMTTLQTKGPQCGLDPDVYEANKTEISRILYAYKNAGFTSVASFLKLSNQAIAANLINRGESISSVLGSYGSYLTETDSEGNVIIDCTANYNASDSDVKAAFDSDAAGADYAQSKGFARVFRELLILNQFEQSKSWSGLRDVLMGTEADETVNNNLLILDLDTTDYDKLKNPDEVFRDMYKQKSSVKEFSDIAKLFANVSEACLKSEEDAADSGKKPSSGGGGSSGGGSSFGGSAITTTGMPSITPEIVENKDTQTKLNDIEGHWAQSSIEALVKNKAISGYDDGSFKPDNNVTRSEFTAMVVRAFGISGESSAEFSDVTPDFWAYSYIQKAHGAGIISGYENGNFGTDDIITREQAAVIIYRAISQKVTLPEGVSDFTDISEFSDYALRPILDLAGAGLINGVGNSLFSPLGKTSRAQSAVMINNALEYIAAK